MKDKDRFEAWFAASGFTKYKESMELQSRQAYAILYLKLKPQEQKWQL